MASTTDSNQENDEAARQAVLAREQQRHRALFDLDFETLADLVTEDLVYVHASGRVEDKAAYLEGLRTRFRFLNVERPGLEVRVFGDIAIATGRLDQVLIILATGQEHTMKAFATQVWVRQGNDWRVASFQATNIPAA
ncbi:MAG: nuclear transport factor 2 family protein [Burkholderiaceae bacterium]